MNHFQLSDVKNLHIFAEVQECRFEFPHKNIPVSKGAVRGARNREMLVWLHNLKTTSEFRVELDDERFRNELIDYLKRIIKQGYHGRNGDVNVSNIIANTHINRRCYKKMLQVQKNKVCKVLMMITKCMIE